MDELNRKHYRCLTCQRSWARWFDTYSFRVYDGKRKRVTVRGAVSHYGETGHEIINPERGPAV